MASPDIVVPTHLHVKPILDVTTSYGLLIIPKTNTEILATMMKLVLLVLPTLVFLLSTIQ
jgi:hypothetical protein